MSRGSACPARLGRGEQRPYIRIALFDCQSNRLYMINSLFNSSFNRNVLTLMTGTTIAQAIPIAISPILTRIYSPKDFGIFAVYVSLLSVISIIATARYELAIMLPKKDTDVFHILIVSVIISSIISAATLLIVFFVSDNLADMIGMKELSRWLYFLPLSIFLTGIYQSFNYWLTRHQKYKYISHNKILQSGVVATSQVGFGALGLGAISLLVSTLAGQLFATCFMSRIVLRDGNFPRFVMQKPRKLALMRKYKKMPLLNAPNAFIDSARIAGINIMISQNYSGTLLGHYALAWRMLQSPISIINGAISQIYFRSLTQVNKGDYLRTLVTFVTRSAIIGIIPFTAIYFLAPQIFSIVFGNKWEIAGNIASSLTPWLYLNFITSPVSSLFIVIGKQEVVLFFSIFYMITPLALLYFFKDLQLLEMMNYLSCAMSTLLVIYLFTVFYNGYKFDRN